MQIQTRTTAAEKPFANSQRVHGNLSVRALLGHPAAGDGSAKGGGEGVAPKLAVEQAQAVDV